MAEIKPITIGPSDILVFSTQQILSKEQADALKERVVEFVRPYGLNHDNVMVLSGSIELSVLRTKPVAEGSD